MKRVSRKVKPALSESWGTVDDIDEDYDDTAELDDIDEDSIPSATPHSLGGPDIDHLGESPTTHIRQRSQTPRSPDSFRAATPSTRRTTRASSRANSVEPEFIMPSPHQSAFSAGSASRVVRRGNRPMSNSSSPSKTPRQGRRADANPQGESGPTYDRAKEPASLQLIMTKLLTYVSQILFQSMEMLRPVFALLFTAGVLYLMIRYVRMTATNALSSAICTIPGVPIVSSLVGSPICQSHHSVNPEFEQLMTVQSAFEDVLSSSAKGANLPMDMKHSESSIRDLKHVVRFSNLPSRNELVFEFTGFIDTARQASADLTRFNARIGSAVDHILSTNRWTLQVIDRVAEVEASRGAVVHLMDRINPFASSRSPDDVVLEQYVRHTRAVEERIADLILQAQALLAILQNLDDRLDIIAGIATRDGVTLKGDRDELFSSLWVKLGGNRSSVEKLSEQLKLLNQVTAYRKMAWAHVVGTILKLQSIASGLEDLRERVSAPEVVGVREDVPLRMHIENIQLGVERLEAQRDEVKKLENDNHRRILDRGAGDMYLEGPRMAQVGPL